MGYKLRATTKYAEETTSQEWITTTTSKAEEIALDYVRSAIWNLLPVKIELSLREYYEK